eukprot:6542116-Heterocapsa_arctica.AAC.1
MTTESDGIKRPKLTSATKHIREETSSKEEDRRLHTSKKRNRTTAGQHRGLCDYSSDEENTVEAQQDEEVSNA